MVVIGLPGFVVVLALISALALRYRISDGFLEITWFFLTLRRIALDEIKYISTKPVWYSEKWHNTILLRNRRLIIYRRNGLQRPISISPKNPFVFKGELDQAIARGSPRKNKVAANVYSGGSLELAHN